MTTAKLFQHGGSQAVRLPKAFRFSGSEVIIEKRGSEVVLKPQSKPQFKTPAEVAKYLADKYPLAGDFPDVTRPRKHERPNPVW